MSTIGNKVAYSNNFDVELDFKVQKDQHHLKGRGQFQSEGKKQFTVSYLNFSVKFLE